MTTENSNTDTGSTDPLYDREHPDHKQAVARHLDSFREPGERVTQPAPAPASARVFTHEGSKRVPVSPEALDKDGLLPASDDHPYYVKEHPLHAQAVRDVQARMRAKFNPPEVKQQPVPVPDPATGEGAERANANAQRVTAEANLVERDEHELRDVHERAGTTPIRLAAPLDAMFDRQMEGDVVAWAADQRIPGQIMNAAISYYAEVMLSRGGLTQENEQQFLSSFVGPGKLTKQQAETLVRYARTIHGVK